jgi:hypothetical protein
MKKIWILHLDAFHQSDAFFLRGLARGLGGRGEELPVVIVHGGEEDAERRLEARGYEVERSEGRLVISTEEIAGIVERATREANHKMAGALTDEVVPAVGIQGTDRGVFRQEEGRAVRATFPPWLRQLVDQGVRPVLSALARGPTGTVIPTPAQCALALALAAKDAGWDAVVVSFTKNRRSAHDFSSGPEITQRAAVIACPDLRQVVHIDGFNEVTFLISTLPEFVDSEGPRGLQIKSNT